MRDLHTITLNRPPDVLTLAAATWLACGAALLGLTPLPLHDATLGWSLAFWLLAAPSLMLLATRLRAPSVDSSSACRVTSHRRPQRAPATRSRYPRNPPARTMPRRGVHPAAVLTH